MLAFDFMLDFMCQAGADPNHCSFVWCTEPLPGLQASPCSEMTWMSQPLCTRTALSRPDILFKEASVERRSDVTQMPLKSVH
jgi:hypothetical protein